MFDPSNIPDPYVPSPTPTLGDNLKPHLERELRAIQSSIKSLQEAVLEIQEHLSNL